MVRQEVPDVGTSPGAVVRFKRSALDTSGLGQPLRELIDWLTAPDPNARPATAQAALLRLDQWLKPDSHRAEKGHGKGRGAGFKATLAACALVVAGLVLWASGLLQGVLAPPPPPLASPYSLAATFEDGSGTLDGNAPDDAAAALLRYAFAESTETVPPADALSLATGLPYPDWPREAADLLTLLQPLDRWKLAVSDANATLTGLAPDSPTRDAFGTALADWQSGADSPSPPISSPGRNSWSARRSRRFWRASPPAGR